MPTFLFEAFDERGQRVSGQIQADEELAATRWLQSRAYSILSMRARSRSLPRLLWAQMVQVMGWNSVGARDLALFTRQFSLMMSAGIHIVRALDCLGQQVWDSPLLAPIARDVSDQVREGAPLSRALGEHSRVFSPVYLSLIVAGERSGALVRVMDSLSEYLERDYRFRTRLQSALAYPALIFLTSFGLLAFLAIFVFPKFMSFFGGLSIEMPWLTNQLYIASLFLGDPWVIAGALLLLPPGLYQARRFWISPLGQHLRDRLTLTLPVLSQLHRHAASARFCRCAAVLIDSGLGQMLMIDLLRGVVGSSLLAQRLGEMGVAIRDEGSSFGREVARSEFFPRMCGPLIAVGEEAGKLPEILNRLAGQLEEEVDLLAVRALSLLEPLMLGMMGIAVAFILWSVMVPIYRLVEAL